MKTARSVGVALAVLLCLPAAPALAQGCLCSGKCYSYPVGPHCDFTAIYCKDCIEMIDFCEDYPCYSAPPPAPTASSQPRAKATKDSRMLLAAVCQRAAKPAGDPAPWQARVIQLKART
jgi:hypothetical protein